MRCRVCRTPLPRGARFCINCAALQPKAVSGQTEPLQLNSGPKLLLRQGICPQCEATTVYTDQDMLPVNRLLIHQGKLNATFAELINYVCVTCGYTERYVAHAKSLEEIRNEWTPVEWKPVDPYAPPGLRPPRK